PGCAKKSAGPGSPPPPHSAMFRASRCRVLVREVLARREMHVCEPYSAITGGSARRQLSIDAVGKDKIIGDRLSGGLGIWSQFVINAGRGPRAKDPRSSPPRKAGRPAPPRGRT